MMFKSNLKVVSDKEIDKFYIGYEEHYICKSLVEMKDKVLKSGIIVEEDGNFKFGYNYIFYFLVARKIADIISDDEGKEVIKQLCSNLHKEKNSNILIFIAHHTKDPFLIDETMLSSMIPFESVPPITLEKDDPFYEMVKDITNEFRDDIVKVDIDPLDAREKNLEAQDKLNRELHNRNKGESEEDEYEYESLNKDLMEFHQSIRSIELVGQIIKNRTGSFKKPKLIELTKELYNTSFRTIGFLGELIKLRKEDFYQAIQHKLKEDEGKTVMITKINLFFQSITFNFCLAMFSRIINSVGSKELREIFDEVAVDINTPASHLVSFSIKTSYGALHLNELKSFVRDFKNNPVAMKILVARVRAYLYYNYIPASEQQKITAALKISHQQPSKKILDKFGR